MLWERREQAQPLNFSYKRAIISPKESMDHFIKNIGDTFKKAKKSMETHA